MILNYYYNNPNIPPRKLCTEIEADFVKRTVHIRNFTDHPLYRAFGVNENPTWKQFESFLRSRCVPEDRYNIKDILENYGLSDVGYEPLSIIRVTGGRMMEDHMELEIGS